MRREAVWTILIALSASGPAAAICLEPSPVHVCTEYFRSDDVVQGKVLSQRKFPDTPDPNNIEGWFYKFAIDKTYRGDAKGTIEIYTGNDETHFPLEVGHSYLLFVNRNQQGRIAPDACGNSVELSKADSVLKAIQTIQKGDKSAAGGDIWGRVNLPVAGSQAMSDSGMPGVPLTAHSYVGRDETADTDDTGRFHIHVPAGHYTVTGVSDKWEIVPYSLSYMKGDFELADGGCADLQFLAQPK
ncbi:MAG TPA: hypothetical protein VKZ79_08670 [Alphaproteobacteria bacterium]|nr:hypothetical protein [Alphaproteobacteria bacterium]